MKQCRRGRGNLIAVAIILAFFVLFTLFNAYLVFFTEDGLSGTYFSQYRRFTLDAENGRGWAVASLILFVVVTLYLFRHIHRTAGASIQYDDRIVIFHFTHWNECRLTWEQLCKPYVNVLWADTDIVHQQIISFQFEDGQKLAVSRSFQGFSQLYQTMASKGVLERYGMMSTAATMEQDVPATFILQQLFGEGFGKNRKSDQ